MRPRSGSARPTWRAGTASALLGALAAAGVLAEPPPGDDPAAALARLRDPHPGVRAKALEALGKTRDLSPEALRSVRDARDDREGAVRFAAVSAIASLAPGRPELASELVEALGGRETAERRVAATALARLPADALLPIADAILERVDPRDGQAVAVLAPPLQRLEAVAPRVVPLLLRSWRMTGHGELEGRILAGGRHAVRPLAAVLDDPDPRAREPVLALLRRLPVDALVDEAERLVPVLLDGLRADRGTSGDTNLFALLVLLAPEVPGARERAVEIAGAWLRFAHASSESLVERAMSEAHGLAARRVEPLRLLLALAREGARGPRKPPPRQWVPWDRWFATVLRELPDPAPDAELLLEGADPALVETLALSLEYHPKGDPFVRALLRSPVPGRRSIALRMYRHKVPSPEARSELAALLGDLDDAGRETALAAIFAKPIGTRVPGSPTAWVVGIEPLSDLERAAVFAALRDWLSRDDRRLRNLALGRVAQLADQGKALGPAVLEIARDMDVRDPDWPAASVALESIGAWHLARPFLLPRLDSPDPWLRAAAITGLAHGRAADPRRLAALTRELLDARDPELEHHAFVATVALGTDAAPLEGWFLARVAGEDPVAASRALDILRLTRLRSDAIFAAALAALARPEEMVAGQAARTLGEFGARAVPALATAAERPGGGGALATLADLSATIPEARRAIEALASSHVPEVARYAKAVMGGARWTEGR